MRRNLNSFKLVPQQSSLWNWWQINSSFNSFHSIKSSSFYLVLSFSHLLKHVYLLNHTNMIMLCGSSLRCDAHGPLAKYLMHMIHLSGNTSGVSKSSSDWLNYTGFPGDVCVAFFNVPPENKNVSHQPPSQNNKAVVFTNVTANAYQGQWNAGFSKVCESEIFKVCGIESLKYIWEFHTLFFYCTSTKNLDAYSSLLLL